MRCMDQEQAMSQYMEVCEMMDSRYDRVDGESFYRYIFPNNENSGEYYEHYERPNAIYLYYDEDDNINSDKLKLKRRIMLNDTWTDDYMDYVERNPFTLCSGLAYRGMINNLDHAQDMNAMIFDLDSVGLPELRSVLGLIEEGLDYPRSIPEPTFIVVSGTGLHLYYVLDEPIALFPNIKTQLKDLKYALTYRIWNPTITSGEKEIQYQSINQGFRMVGSTNNKYGTEVLAYKTGGRVSLNYLNQFAWKEKDRVDINKRYRPSRYSLEEAKKKFPDWYEQVIVEKKPANGKWNVSKNVYDWWKRRAPEVRGGHRYYFMMCMSIYASKCNVDKAVLEEDLIEAYKILDKKEHTNPLTMQDVYSALAMYDKDYFKFTIDDISTLTELRIEKNRRNGRNQEQHIKIMNAIRDVEYPNGEWRNKDGRPKGSGEKKEIVYSWRQKNPDGRKVDCINATGLSKKTVYKWWDWHPDHD